MDINTGKIKFLSIDEFNNLSKSDKDKLVEIKEEFMTDKQKEEMKVSLHDNKSKLGKLRISEKTKRNRDKRWRKKNK